MRLLRSLHFRVQCLLWRGHAERDLSDELTDYLERQTQRYIQDGLSPENAHTAALRDAGGPEQLKEACRDVRGTAFIEDVARDLRYGFRVLCKNPSFFVTASLTLALGIGTATTLFSVAESQLWRPLPFPEPNRLAVIWERNLKQKWQASSVAVATFADWRERNHTFASMAAMQWPKRSNFVSGEFRDRPRVAAVSTGFFETLRVLPQVGRTFGLSDEQPGKQTKTILSGKLACQAFGSPEAAIDTAIKLDGETYSVAGVLPDQFRLDLFQTPDVYVPLEVSYAKSRELRDLFVIGRMRPGVTVKGALSDMEVVAQGIAAEHPETNANFSAVVENPLDNLPASVRTFLLLSFAFSIFVLLIACSNVAGLQLMRAVAREREFAVREALGASRPALFRQALTESAWIAMTGAGFGTLLAAWCTHLLRSSPLESMLPRETEVSLNIWSIVFAVAISVGAAFLFGVAPDLLRSKLNLEASLRDSGRSASAGKGVRRRIEILAGGEVTLAFISLFGAGLFVISNWDLQHVPLGFNPRNVLAMEVPLSGATYSKQPEVRKFYERVSQAIATLPGIQEFALSSGIPFLGGEEVTFLRPDRAHPPHGQEPWALTRNVTPEYFQTLGIPIVRGRGFTAEDSEVRPTVAVINENFASHHFHGENPVGKQLAILSKGDSELAERTIQIVGVVGNVRDVGLDEVPFDDLYIPFAQHPLRFMYVVVKTSAPSIGRSLRGRMRQLDPAQFVSDPKPLDSYVGDAIQEPRFNLLLITLFAGFALILTAVALYGTVAFAIAQETREIGIRIALGAQRTGVLDLIFRRVLRLTVAGSICGFGIAFVIGAMFRTALYMVPYEHEGILYRVSIHDPSSFACSALIVLLSAGLTGLIPGIRATKIDPYSALRCE
ncbi:MAG: ABC transporter permease [Acidobacteriaceae bacterium]|nr:ABC transporter permease [Acidobacteriaceae bacterium]